MPVVQKKDKPVDDSQKLVTPKPVETVERKKLRAKYPKGFHVE